MGESEGGGKKRDTETVEGCYLYWLTRWGPPLHPLSCSDIWGNKDHSSPLPHLRSLFPSPNLESLLIRPWGNTWIWYGRKRRGRQGEERGTGREESISEADTIAIEKKKKKLTQGDFLQAQEKAVMHDRLKNTFSICSTFLTCRTVLALTLSASTPTTVWWCAHP